MLVLDLALVLVVLALLAVGFFNIFSFSICSSSSSDGSFFCNSRVSAMSSIIRSSICHSSRESEMFT